VHTVNINVINIITLAHQVMDKQLNVILLQQDQAHTKRIISRLRMASVSYQAVPEYALNHFIGKADKMFFGALSITADGQVVAPIGTANITSLCHFHHIPVYLFANTLKFSMVMPRISIFTRKPSHRPKMPRPMSSPPILMT
jgi:translation initiation factor eIF-2B subunit alpha